MTATIVVELARALPFLNSVVALPVIDGTPRVEGQEAPVRFHHGPSIGEHSPTPLRS